MKRQDANACQHGHTAHRSRVVETIDGPLRVWNWDAYANLGDGYCPGRDDTSRTLALYGTWEPLDTALYASLIRPGDQVWDFGSHIGWFTRIALKRGGQVYAVDADPEMMRLLHHNCQPWADQLTTETAWAADAHPPETDRLRILKADVEGAEMDAVAHAWDLIFHRRADYLFLECSPEFDTYYPPLIDEIIGCGYTASTVDGTPVTGPTLGPTQTNVWFAVAPPL